MGKIVVELICAAVAAALIGGCTDGVTNSYDLVITGGRVIDPETDLDGIRNVGINGGRIESVTSDTIRGKQHIDATGLVVSPGFIDLHDHAQNIAGQTYHVRDGVTTGLELEGGVYPFPNQETDVQPLQKQLHNREGKSLINYGYSAGFYGARLIAKDRDLERTKYEISNEQERNKIYSLIEQQLDSGAIGIGLPLDYISKGVNNVELEGIFRLAARRQVPLFVHIRMSDDALDPSGFQELIDMVRKTGASLHMVHITSTGLGRTPLYIDMLEKARTAGMDITAEVYPYTANQTGINAQILDGDWETRWGISYQDVEWPPTGERFTGKAMWDEYKEKYPDENVIMHSMKEGWVDMAIRHPGVMIISDGYIERLDQRVHPRVAGTYARVLGRYVRERQILSLPEAIRKMTYLPARRLQGFTAVMKRKGRIQVGADADITIFDPETVVDRATFAEPNQFSMGIKYVIVGGELVVKEGEIQPGVFPGKPVTAKLQPGSAEKNELSANREAIVKKIDVGGYDLNFRYTPGSLPAIVFESGGGMDSVQWTNIQNALGSEIDNAIVSYDRAGMGESGLYIGEYNIEREVEALHSGLEQLGLADQFFLAGHSYGGLLIRMFAHMYANSVSSLLYIDANTVSYVESQGGAEKYIKPITQHIYPPDKEPENNYHKAMKKQVEAFPKTITKIKNSSRLKIPCKVISADIPWHKTKQENDQYRKAHQKLAESCQTDLIIAKGSDHYIPANAPDLVISTIKDMLENTR